MKLLKLLTIGAFLATCIAAPPTRADSTSLILELETAFARSLIGIAELKKLQQSLLRGILVNPVNLGVPPEPEVMAAHARIQDEVESGDVEHAPVLEWLNGVILKYEGANHDAVNKVAKNILHSGQTLTPFVVIRHVARVNLSGLMRSGLVAAGFKNAWLKSEREMTTSCINTAIVLPFIFLGYKKAQRLVEGVRTEFTPIRRFELADGFKFKFRMRGLFDGLMPSDLDERIALFAREHEAIDSYLSTARCGINDLEKTLLCDANKIFKDERDFDKRKSALCALLANPGYAFNRAVIHKLKNEMVAACEFIAQDKSVLYVVYAKMQSRFNQKHRATQHAFIIQQYLHDGEPRFMLHQSWVNHATFLENVTRQRFANQEVWDLKALEVFLADLEYAYCEKMDAKSLWRCFGYGQTEPATPLVTFMKGHMVGVAMAYIAVPFNPDNVMRNLGELMSCGLTL